MQLIIRIVQLQFIIFIRAQIMKEARQKMLADLQVVVKRPRFGLFSQPPPIAVGDNSYFHAKSANKGEDGKPKTKPRNMLAGMNRTGMGKRAFINYPESIYQKDPYKDPFKIELQYQRKIRGKSAMHENQFKPVSGTKTLTNASYVHIEEKQPRQGKKIQRDENGRVKTEPSNLLTNPTSKIEDKLFQHVKHMRDEYSRPHDIQKQQRVIWREKIKSQTMFRSTSHGGNYFTKEKIQFGLDQAAKKLMQKRKPFRFNYSQSRMKHEIRFKLARRGHGDPIGRYPDFVSSRVRTQGNQARSAKGSAEKEIWRPSTGDFTRPTPSITLMAQNLRKHL